MGIRSSVRLWASFVALAAVSLPVAAAPQAGDKSAAAQQRKGSGLPIPRFASLRSDEVNVRTGPGPRYPDRLGLQAQGHAGRDRRRVRELAENPRLAGSERLGPPEPAERKAQLHHRSQADRLHKTPATSAEVVAKLEPEVMGEIRSCTGDWCRVKAAGVSGWIERTGMWGVYKSEPIN